MYLAIRDFLRKFDLDITRASYGRTLGGRLKSLMSGQQIDCVLDVGANAGQFATNLRRLGYKGTIISFEPASAPFRQLSEMARREQAWSVHQLALGNLDEEGVLNVMQDSTLNSFHKPSVFGAEHFTREVIDHQETVPVKRLDSILNFMEPSAKDSKIFLKIDTQGHDLEAFRGASGCFSQVRLLQMELSVKPIYEGIPDWQSVIKEVQEGGFALAGLFAVNYGNAGEVLEFDGVFVRPQSCS